MWKFLLVSYGEYMRAQYENKCVDEYLYEYAFVKCKIFYIVRMNFF